MNPDELRRLLERCDPDRVELPQHVYERARKRNVDPGELEDKILTGAFEKVRENSQDDPAFEHSYRVTLTSDGDRVEVPIYFNIPGPRILVKSIWRG